MTDLMLRSLVAISALVQIITPAYVNPFRDGQNPLRTSVPSQIEPAGYAFAIWGPIYLLALGYAIWQLLPAGRADRVSAQIAPLALAVYVGSSVWLLLAAYGPLWATVPILAAIAVCACIALVTAVTAPAASAWRWWSVILPFGMYAGWTTCATVVNIAEVAPTYGFGRLGLSVPSYGVVLILAALVVAAIVLYLSRGEAVFAATIVWALVAIIVAAQQRGAAGVIQVAAAFGIVTVVVLSAWLKGKGPASTPS